MPKLPDFMKKLKLMLSVPSFLCRIWRSRTWWAGEAIEKVSISNVRLNLPTKCCLSILNTTTWLLLCGNSTCMVFPSPLNQASMSFFTKISKRKGSTRAARSSGARESLLPKKSSRSAEGKLKKWKAGTKNYRIQIISCYCKIGSWQPRLSPSKAAWKSSYKSNCSRRGHRIKGASTTWSLWEVGWMDVSEDEMMFR